MALGRWGFWLQGDQMLHRPSPDSKRSLWAFAVFGDAGPATALLQTYWRVGLVKKGTFEGRDNDSIGIAVNSSWISSTQIAAQNQANAIAPGSTPVQSSETTIEVNYRAQPTPWLSLHAERPVRHPAQRFVEHRKRAGARLSGQGHLLV